MGNSESGKSVIVSAGSSTGMAVGVALGCSLLWYAFDDALARVTGVPTLGTLSYWMVLPMCLFASLLLSMAGTSWSDG